jgi:hypothetical protein
MVLYVDGIRDVKKQPKHHRVPPSYGGKHDTKQVKTCVPNEKADRPGCKTQYCAR